jgi:hypothetical protein
MKPILSLALSTLLLAGQARIPGPGGETVSSSSSSGISFVNAASETPSAFGSQTISLSVTAGNLLYAFASDQEGGTALTVSDLSNGTWNLIGSDYNVGIGINIAQFSIANTVTATLTVSVSSNATNGGLPVLTVLQFHGQTSATPIGYAGGVAGSSPPITSGTFSASAGNLIVFGCAVHGTSTLTAGNPSGMAIPANGNPSNGNGSAAVEYAIAGSSATAATISWSASQPATGMAAVFH